MAGQDVRQDAGGWTIRWDAARATRARAAGLWPDRTIAQQAEALVAADPDHVLLHDRDQARTRAALHADALRLAGYFRSLGLARGDVVSFQLPNWWEASVINLAAAMVGVVANPIVPIYRDAEVRYMLEESRSRLVFFPRLFRNFDHAGMIARILPDLSRRPHLVVVRDRIDGIATFDEALQAPPVDGPDSIDPDAVKLLMYTSGTTGRPKGVLHSHNSLAADSLKMVAAMALGPGDVTFSPSPVTHVSGYLWALNAPWVCGVPAAMIDSWDANDAFDTIRRHGCAFAVGATPFLQDLVAVAKARGEGLDSLRYYMCGGASVPPQLIREAADLFPNCIPYRTFGATEVPTMTMGPTARDRLDLAAETDGRLLHCEVKLVDPVTGAPLAEGEEGEILAREPSMALGYARAEDNEAAYDDEGYFRMGDLGRLVDGQYVVCTGRKKDLIIRAGENISAREIEDVLFRSPLIDEVAVVSMPSRRTGEAICAFVVPAPGTAEGAIDLPVIAALLRAEGLAVQKTPERIIIATELPKTASGKVRKDQLRAVAAADAEQWEQTR